MRFSAPALDCMGSIHDLSALFEKTAFVYRTCGDSMINAHIPHGAWLAVDRQIKAANGMIVIAEVGGIVMVRRLVKTTRLTVLHPENPYYKPLIITPEMNMIIYGVVTTVIITSP